MNIRIPLDEIAYRRLKKGIGYAYFFVNGDGFHNMSIGGG
jgi:hypothetical protein